MSVISVMNHKGGVGKTFLSLHLVKGLSMLDYKVLGVDYDTQGDLMKWGSRGKWRGEKRLNVDGADFVFSPGDIYLEDKYDFVVVDGRPEYSAMPTLFNYSDMLIVPVDGRLSMDGAEDVASVRKEIKKTSIPIVIVRNKMETLRGLNQKETKILQALADRYQVKIDVLSLPYSPSVRMAEVSFLTLWDIKTKGGATMREYVKMLVNYISNIFGDGRILEPARRYR